MDAKLKKLIIKGAVGLATAAVIGYIIKLEKRLDAHIDEHYAEQDTPEN